MKDRIRVIDIYNSMKPKPKKKVKATKTKYNDPLLDERTDDDDGLDLVTRTKHNKGSQDEQKV